MPTIKLALFYDGKLDLRALWLMPFPARLPPTVAGTGRGHRREGRDMVIW